MIMLKLGEKKIANEDFYALEKPVEIWDGNVEYSYLKINWNKN